jgi:phenylalanine ammonia-lyase
MLIRINSLASGHSGVRPVLVTRMVDLLRNNVVPRIPLRGSISASGDLMPLSYLGGLLQGKPSITVWSRSPKSGKRRIVTADVALAEQSLEPIRLGPKEGLAIINGTAVSTGVAALVMHDANNLAVLSQILTAMSVEVLCGNGESFDPFFAAVRPHPGQIEAAQNIYHFLNNSKLTDSNHALEEGALRQDRYSIRTASQWLGPILEDLLLAHKQIAIECNSVTDNPLVDTANARMLHGGNFQAKAITSAMEKTRLALQTIGQMLFAQCTEIINPRLNNGLPPNLTADDPSRSFLFKPVDIMIAALQSELGFLANPVGSHVLSAEMGNQALNSLALISARYAFVAIDVLSQLAAAHLFALCQALDLRAMQIRFLDEFEPVLRADTDRLLGDLLDIGIDRESLHVQLWLQFQKMWEQTSSLDPGPRFASIFRSLEPIILDFTSPSWVNNTSSLRKWTKHSSGTALKIFVTNRDAYSADPDARPYLGMASRRIYDIVRNQLAVPFVRTDELEGELSIGSLITKVYSSIRNGSLYGPVMECLMEVEQNGIREKRGGAKL